MEDADIPQIESIAIDELAEAVIESQDNMVRWEIVTNKFRIMRHNQQIMGVIPTTRITTNEVNLFNKPIIKRYSIFVDLLEKPNLELFFMCAIKAREEDIKLVEK